MWQGKVKIVTNEEVAPECFRMALEAPQIAEEARAGQFLHVKVVAGLAPLDIGSLTGYSPLLRRPFSVHRIKPQFDIGSLTGVEILYKVVGRGTKLLARLTQGEELDILGPLGSGFKVPAEGKATLVAGGIGVAPLLALAEELAERGSSQATIIIGAATKELVLCEEDFKKLGLEIQVATEDGSYGHKGLATDLLRQLLSTIDYRLSIIFACGPPAMLKKIAEMTSERNIPAQLSLERQMGCGVGACLGCVLKVKNAKGKGEGDFSYKRVCKDGPVFEANVLDFTD